MATVGYIARKLFAAAAVLFFGPIGLIFGLFGLGFSIEVIAAMVTGEFVRDDLREGTGEVHIFRSTDPGWFWDNIYFWSVIAALSALMASLFIPLFWLAFKSLLGRSTARKRE